ncbi:hypothetical protein JCM10213_003020 [Rhodosporidiobolus nylandii]
MFRVPQRHTSHLARPPPSRPLCRRPKRPSFPSSSSTRSSAASQKTMGNLARCCLVSRDFLALARPRLWRVLKLRLGSGNPYPLYEADLATSAIVRGVTRNPYHSSPLVRRLEIRSANPGTIDPYTRLALDKADSTILTYCASVQELAIDPGHEDRFVAAVLALGWKPSVRRLELAAVTDQAWRVLELFQDTVQHPELDARSSTPTHQFLPQFLPNLRLTSLNLSTFVLETDDFLTSLILSVMPTLNSLEIWAPISAIPSLSSFPNLHRLHLKVLPREAKQTFMDGLPSLLDGCETLQSLAISNPNTFTLSNIRTLSSASADALPAHLPPTLERLHLRASYFFPADLIAILRAAPQAKKLREIGREPYQLHLGKRDRKKRPELPTHEEEEQLERECRKRGVRLVAL